MNNPRVLRTTRGGEGEVHLMANNSIILCIKERFALQLGANVIFNILTNCVFLTNTSIKSNTFSAENDIPSILVFLKGHSHVESFGVFILVLISQGGINIPYIIIIIIICNLCILKLSNRYVLSPSSSSSSSTSSSSSSTSLTSSSSSSTYM